jgi:hypothetical protein
MVVWTIRARRKLDEAIAQQIAEGHAPAVDPPAAGKRGKAAAAAKDERSVSERKRAELSGVLTRTFPGETRPIVVQDLFTGYRPDDKHFVMLVEIVTAELSGAEPDPRPGGSFVVKHGPPADMQKELDAWRSCRPEGLRNDVVLMAVEGKYDKGTLVSLIYDDAQQFIGVDQTVPLEQAMIDTVLYGNPSLASVRTVLFSLYERLGLLLYRVSYNDPGNPPAGVTRPNGATDRVFVIRRLWESLQRWDEQFARPPLTPEEWEQAARPFPVEHRGQVIRNSVRDRDREATPKRKASRAEPKEKSDRVFFIDPIGYLRFVKLYTTWYVPGAEVKGKNDSKSAPSVGPTPPVNESMRGRLVTAQPAESIEWVELSRQPAEKEPAEREPLPEELLPTLRRGRAHGDLHGRNVLVGVVEDEVVWPAVYDFESMRPDNFIAWDFVKLETELKIRVFRRVFPLMPLSEFAPKVMTFDHGLNRWTNWCNDGERWPRADDLRYQSAPPAEPTGGAPPVGGPEQLDETSLRLARLRNLLLGVRQRASTHLRYRADTPDEWFRQYLFLLMCYGVSSVRFKNLDRLELAAAYVTAGVAAEWLELREWARATPRRVTS